MFPVMSRMSHHAHASSCSSPRLVASSKSRCSSSNNNSSSPWRNRKRRPRQTDRHHINREPVDVSTSSSALDTDRSLSCQSADEHDDEIRLEAAASTATAAAAAAASRTTNGSSNSPPRKAPRIMDCHTLANGWFDAETGLVALCLGSAQSSSLSAARRRQTDAVQLTKVEEYWRPSLIYAGTPGNESHVLSAERLLHGREGVTEHVQGRLLNDHESQTYYGSRGNLQFLESGGAFYSFTCRTNLTPYERDMMKTMANMTSFEDEHRDNFVPGFDVDNIHDVQKYTFVVQKAAYLLPVHLSALTPELLSGVDYHRNCQPSGAVIWDDQIEDYTFRFTRPIVRHLYYMTIQFRVSKIGRNDLDALSALMGVRVDHGILMERTKRSKPPKVDGTAKAKSILCYTAVPGGVLVTHATVILNTAIPSVVSGIIHSFGGMGLKETCETVERTRRYLIHLGSD